MRSVCCERTGLKKGAWSQEEDRKLTAYINRYGHWNWRELPKFAGLSRCGKSCRLRWMNYLRPNIKRGNYSREEEELIIKLHESLGNKWASIAAKLPGRTDNEIKNHWHTNLKKRLKQNSTSSDVKLDSEEYSSREVRTTREIKVNCFLPNSQMPQILESSLFSPQLSSSSSDFSSLQTDSPVGTGTNWVTDENTTSSVSNGDFWTEPFFAGNSYIQDDFPMPLVDHGIRNLFEDPFCGYNDDCMDLFDQLIQGLQEF